MFLFLESHTVCSNHVYSLPLRCLICTNLSAGSGDRSGGRNAAHVSLFHFLQDLYIMSHHTWNIIPVARMN